MSEISILAKIEELACEADPIAISDDVADAIDIIADVEALEIDDWEDQIEIALLAYREMLSAARETRHALRRRLESRFCVNDYDGDYELDDWDGARADDEEDGPAEFWLTERQAALYTSRDRREERLAKRIIDRFPWNKRQQRIGWRSQILGTIAGKKMDVSRLSYWLREARGTWRG